MYHYRAYVDRVVDADTLDLEIDLGMGISTHQRVRLMGINAWETRGEEREKGLAAKQFVVDWLCRIANLVNEEDLEGACPRVYIRTELDSAGKYGRLLVWVYAKEDGVGTEALNHVLVDEGHARYVDY